MALHARLGHRFERHSLSGFWEPEQYRWYFAGPTYDPFGEITNSWVSSLITYNYGEVIQPTAPNGHYYVCVLGSDTVTVRQSGLVEPTWPTDGSTVVDNEVIWKDAGTQPPFEHRLQSISWAIDGSEGVTVGYAPAKEVWQATTAYVEKQDFVTKVTNDGVVFMCTTSGTTGGSEPTWGSAEGQTTSDGTVVWTSLGTVNPGAYTLPTNGSYDRVNGLAAVDVGTGNVVGWTGGDLALVPLSAATFTVDSTAWVGESLKWLFLVNGSTPFRAGPGLTSGDDTLINIVVAQIDLDDTLPGGIPITTGGETLLIQLPTITGTPVGNGVIVEFDHTRF